MSDSNIASELDSFREQWQAEVRARNPVTTQQPAEVPSTSARKPARVAEPPRKPGKGKEPARDSDQDDLPQAHSSDGQDGGTVGLPGPSISEAAGEDGDEQLVSALDHYEKAAEKEAAGSLGDSLRLYRKAFRMDHRVDQKYKSKYFPAAAAPKPGQASPSNTRATVPNTAQHSQDGQPQSMEELIESFASFAIEPSPPEMEGMAQPPCPLASLPGEILVHILRDVAVLDIGDFVRLSRVCKRLAYLVATEDRIWRRVCLGPEFGFGGMHYRWQRAVSWGPLPPEEDEDEGHDDPPADAGARRRCEDVSSTHAFLEALYSSSWQRMFRLRPRIRFGGCYISTVNYIRSGQSSSNQVTWNSPVHIVTYYRYLRFFRDGTAISLVTAAQPADVVRHLTRDALALHAGSAAAHLPSAFMQSALRGRWRLSTAADGPLRSVSEAEGDVFVETEGVGKYIYRLDLAMRSASRGAKNNKLVWKGFWSYDPLTDDWAEFGLKNDKPYHFSHVRSYGVGE